MDRALAEVGLDREYRERYSHQISGGQRQRIGIARALMVEPRFLVCDEPVAALDVSIQAQVINLFMDLREQRGLTYLFISHDLGVVRHISDRVAIMYLGKIVEQASSAEIFAHPNHPYTQALMAEVPDVGRRGRVFTPIRGEIPSPLDPPPGCTFHPRCPHAMPRCREQAPVLREIAARPCFGLPPERHRKLNMKTRRPDQRRPHCPGTGACGPQRHSLPRRRPQCRPSLPLNTYRPWRCYPGPAGRGWCSTALRNGADCDF